MVDMLIAIILTELFCFFSGNKDIKAVFDILHQTEGMGDQSTAFNEAYSLFYMQFMILYQTFLKILISYKGALMMLFKGKTIGLHICALALVSRKQEEYYLTCLRYLADALLTALSIFVFNSMPYIISLFFVFSDENCCTLIEKICALKLTESR